MGNIIVQQNKANFNHYKNFFFEYKNSIFTKPFLLQFLAIKSENNFIALCIESLKLVLQNSLEQVITNRRLYAIR
jgi:hypothetical protein